MSQAIPREYEVLAPMVAVDPATGAATISSPTDREPILLHLSGSDLLSLQDQIAKMLAQARHGGLYMLPAAVGCHGLEAGIGRSQLQIRLVLENGSEGRLPVQELALHRLNKILTDWFADQEDRNADDNLDD